MQRMLQWRNGHLTTLFCTYLSVAAATLRLELVPDRLINECGDFNADSWWTAATYHWDWSSESNLSLCRSKLNANTASNLLFLKVKVPSLLPDQKMSGRTVFGDDFVSWVCIACVDNSQNNVFLKLANAVLWVYVCRADSAKVNVARQNVWMNHSLQT